ncbi:unnamed protein product, partial [Ixodes persulcatus]
MSRRTSSYGRTGGANSRYSPSCNYGSSSNATRSSAYSTSAPSYGSSGRYSGSGLAPSLNIYAPSYKTAGTTSGYGSDYGRGSRPSSGYGSGYGSDYGKSTGSGYISDYGRSGGGYASDYGNRNSGYGSDYNRSTTLRPVYGRQPSYQGGAGSSGGSYGTYRRPSNSGSGSVANVVKMFGGLARQSRDDSGKPPMGRTYSVRGREDSRPAFYRMPSREDARSTGFDRRTGEPMSPDAQEPKASAAPLTKSESKGGKGGLAPADFTSTSESESEEEDSDEDEPPQNEAPSRLDFATSRGTSPARSAGEGSCSAISNVDHVPKSPRTAAVGKRSLAQQVDTADLEASRARNNGAKRPTSFGSAIPRQRSNRTTPSPTSSVRSRSSASVSPTSSVTRIAMTTSPSSRIPVLNGSTVTKTSSPPRTTSLTSPSDSVVFRSRQEDEEETLQNKDFRKSVLNMNLSELELEEYLSRQREQRDRCSQQVDKELENQITTTTTESTSGEEQEVSLSRSSSARIGKSGSKSKLIDASLRPSGSRTIVSRSSSQNRLPKRVGSRDNILQGSQSNDRVYDRSRSASGADLLETTTTDDDEDISEARSRRVRRRRKGSRENVLDAAPTAVVQTPVKYDRQESSSSVASSSTSSSEPADSAEPGPSPVMEAPHVTVTTHTTSEGDDEEEDEDEEDEEEDEVASLAVTPVPSGGNVSPESTTLASVLSGAPADATEAEESSDQEEENEVEEQEDDDREENKALDLSDIYRPLHDHNTDASDEQIQESRGDNDVVEVAEEESSEGHLENDDESEGPKVCSEGDLEEDAESEEPEHEVISETLENKKIGYEDDESETKDSVRRTTELDEEPKDETTDETSAEEEEEDAGSESEVDETGAEIRLEQKEPDVFREKKVEEEESVQADNEAEKSCENEEEEEEEKEEE